MEHGKVERTVHPGALRDPCRPVPVRLGGVDGQVSRYEKCNWVLFLLGLVVVSWMGTLTSDPGGLRQHLGCLERCGLSLCMGAIAGGLFEGAVGSLHRTRGISYPCLPEAALGRGAAPCREYHVAAITQSTTLFSAPRHHHPPLSL